MGTSIDAVSIDNALKFASIMGVLETFANYCLKKYAKTDELQYISGGIAGYAGVIYMFQRALREEKLYRVNNFWNAFTTVSNTLVGVSMGEKITSIQILGIGLITIGALLI